MKYGLILMCSVLALGIASCQPSTPSDNSGNHDHGDSKAAVSDMSHSHSDSVEVAFQNEYVRVKEFNLKPNEYLPAHGGEMRVVYSLNDYKLEWTINDEVMGKRSWKRGDSHVHEPDTHAVKNIGTDTASFVIFERLDAALPAKPAHTKAHKLQKGSTKRLEDTNFKLVEIELQPGESQEMHTGSWRAIYSLSDYTIEWRENDKVLQKSWKAGDTHWHGTDAHAAKNIGDTTARWLVVALKK